MEAKKIRVLISGGGIAGPVLAYWLNKGGIDCTIVERADRLRLEGQVIDIRSMGVEVVRKMGLEEIIRSKTTHEEGLYFVDRENREKAFFPVDDNGESFTCDIEIMRGVLATIFYDAIKDEVKYVFGDYITSIKETSEKCTVEFKNGPIQDYDIVVAADGWGSKARGMVLQTPDDPIHSLNQYSAYFSIPWQESDGTCSRWYNAPGGLSMLLRPDGKEWTRAYLNITNSTHPDLTERKRFQKLDRSQQKALLHETFKDAGWEAPRTLEAMDTTHDFYMQETVQVKMDRWTSDHGRFALIGDAAYCPSPISGVGTTCAILGAYTLAGNILSHVTSDASSASLQMAMEGYERDLRPFITKAQSLPPGVPAIANPQTQFGINILNGVLGFITWSGLATAFGRFMISRPETLKTYEMELKPSLVE